MLSYLRNPFLKNAAKLAIINKPILLGGTFLAESTPLHLQQAGNIAIFAANYQFHYAFTPLSYLSLLSQVWRTV